MGTPHDYASKQHQSSMGPKYPPQRDPTVGPTNTPHDYSSKHYQPSMGPKYPPQRDPTVVGPTNEEYQYQLQQQPTIHQQEPWQQQHQMQQQYQMNQQQQNNLQQRGQGREMFQNQVMRPGGGDMYAEGTVHSTKHLSPKNPAPVSEVLNEEIRIQANLQRRQQQQDEFESGLAYDPYLICHKCNRQFREGQLPEYRHHIDNCQQ